MCELRRSVTFLATLLFLPTLLNVRAEGREEVLARDRTVYRYVRPGSWKYRVPGEEKFTDPVPALSNEDLALFDGGLTHSETGTIVRNYVERMTTVYAEKYGFPPELTALLQKNTDARDIFIPALSPRYDDISAAARILHELHQLDKRALTQYIHLATAIAVVYDQPDAVISSRYCTLWLVEPEQFPEPPSFGDVFKFYTSGRRKRGFGFRLDKLPWQVLVHVVDNDVSADERAWAFRRYAGAGWNMQKVYHLVPYDYDKFERGDAALALLPYTLENLVKFGGVCSDRAHFCTRVAKSVGVPAMKVSGENRYGGHHAWTGYLVIRSGQRLLVFAGRYLFDYYYTGEVFDPQTRTRTLDRFVAMMYDGASLSYPKYNQSRLLIRIAEAIFEEHPQESLELTTQALRLNYFTMWGWPLLMEHVKAGTMSTANGLWWFNEMLRVLKDHPDMTVECLKSFLGCVPKEDIRKRQSMYNQAFVLYKKRPDLQLRLRMAQSRELVDAAKGLAALNVLIPTIIEHSEEGTLVLPAVELAVELAEKLNLRRPVYAGLAQADVKFPKTRGGRPSESYAEFKKMVSRLLQ